jgi:hypothetical protein
VPLAQGGTGRRLALLLAWVAAARCWIVNDLIFAGVFNDERIACFAQAMTL